MKLPGYTNMCTSKAVPSAYIFPSSVQTVQTLVIEKYFCMLTLWKRRIIQNFIYSDPAITKTLISRVLYEPCFVHRASWLVRIITSGRTINNRHCYLLKGRKINLLPSTSGESLDLVLQFWTNTYKLCRINKKLTTLWNRASQWASFCKYYLIMNSVKIWESRHITLIKTEGKLNMGRYGHIFFS